MYNDDRTGDSLARFVVGSLHRVRGADDSRNIQGRFDDRSSHAATPDSSGPAVLMRFFGTDVPTDSVSIFHGISQQVRRGLFTGRVTVREPPKVKEKIEWVEPKPVGKVAFVEITADEQLSQTTVLADRCSA